MLNGHPIASGDDVAITDIGEGDAAVICMTDKEGCCSSNKQGEWRFPNNTTVGTEGKGGDFYRNRGNQQVILNRRRNALGPLGQYCCEVATVDNPNARICIDIGKQSALHHCHFVIVIRLSYYSTFGSLALTIGILFF